MDKNKPIKMALLFGGRSAEHEISIISARSVSAAIDRGKYGLIPIYISRKGRWYSWPDFDNKGATAPSSNPLLPIADPERKSFLVSNDGKTKIAADIVFPLLHGPYGEDGTVQGLLELAGIPFVGSGVTGSALAMDKALSKNILRAEGLATPDFLSVDRVAFRGNGGKITDTIESTLGYPIFVKPANMGSSVGVTKVLRREEIEPALDEAFKFDAKAICEQGIIGRELECSVLGNLEPEAAEVGEIIPKEGFYDYKAKYVTDDAALVIPADIPPTIHEEVREKAIRAFIVHDCRGLARVDFFYIEEKGQVLINELNTMPGFTPISMYPKLWDAVGLSYPQLINRLIELAFERAEEKAHNVVGYDEAVDV